MTSFVTIYDTSLDLQSKDAPDLNGRVSGRGLRDHPEEFISMQEYDILEIEFLFKYAPPPPPYAHTH